MQVLTEIFRRGGWTAVIVAAVASIGIWGLAHFAATPGTQVSVLWGLVQYTKVPLDKAPMPSAPGSTLPKTEPLAAKSAIENPPPASPAPHEETKVAPIKVTHGITAASDQAISRARSQEGLRMLRPLEEGKGVEDTPEGTYYFVIAPQTWSDNTFLAQIEKLPSIQSADFEFRHRKGEEGVALVAYTMENDANRLLALEGSREFTLVASGEPWNDFTSMVEIPVSRIKSSKSRQIERGTRTILDLVVQ